MQFLSQRAGLVLALLVTLFDSVVGHGFMTTPNSRNEGEAGGCEHCLNAGGPGSVYGNGYTHGMCGDGPEDLPQEWNAAGTPTSIGMSGDSFLIEIEINAHHLGYFEFELCDTPDITEDCFRSGRLYRTDCDPDTEGEQFCRRWWKPAKSNEYSHYSFTPQGYPDGAPFTDGCNYVTYGMMYDIPEDVSCTHCVLRWHWYTTNSCTSDDSVGEEFWNCADVSIEDPNGNTIDTTPEEGYDALNDRLTTTLPVDLSGDRTDDDNWQCPDPSYGLPGEYTCSLTYDANGTEACYASSTGETCNVQFYENQDQQEEGIPEVSYCTWSGFCLADGVGGSEYCDESEDNCEGSCGGSWCKGWNDIESTYPYTGEPTTTQSTTTTVEGPGFCSWTDCADGAQPNEWCDAEKTNCEGACNGFWCPLEVSSTTTDAGTTTTDAGTTTTDAGTTTTDAGTTTTDAGTTTTDAPATTTTDAPTTTTAKPPLATTTIMAPATTTTTTADQSSCDTAALLEEIASLTATMETLLLMVEEMKADFDASVCSDPVPTTTTTTQPGGLTLLQLSDIGAKSAVDDWTMTGPEGATLGFSDTYPGVRIRNGDAGGETQLFKFAEGSERYPYFLVAGTIAAERLENEDSCALQASTDGGETWESLLVLGNGQDDTGLGTSASAIFGGAQGVTVRLLNMANGKYDDCFLVEASVVGLNAPTTTSTTSTTTTTMMPNNRLRG